MGMGSNPIRSHAASPPNRGARGRTRQRACSHQGIALASGAALLALLSPAMHHSELRLVWNASASVPVGLYRIVPGSAPRVGDLIALRPAPALTRFMAARKYVEAGALLVKPVAAIAGKLVCRAGSTVTIDRVKVTTALDADHVGRPLPVWTGCVRLRRGTLFLLAPKASSSFDGRYFGPVAVAGIVGRAVPIWTRP